MVLRREDNPETHEKEMYYREADADCPHPRPDDCLLPLEECPHDGYCPLDAWFDDHPNSTDGECHICLERPIGLVCVFCTYEHGDIVMADQCNLLTNPCGHMYCDPDACEDDYKEE